MFSECELIVVQHEIKSNIDLNEITMFATHHNLQIGQTVRVCNTDDAKEIRKNTTLTNYLSTKILITAVYTKSDISGFNVLTDIDYVRIYNFIHYNSIPSAILLHVKNLQRELNKAAALSEQLRDSALERVISTKERNYYLRKIKTLEEKLNNSREQAA